MVDQMIVVDWIKSFIADELGKYWMNLWQENPPKMPFYRLNDFLYNKQQKSNHLYVIKDTHTPILTCPINLDQLCYPW